MHLLAPALHMNVIVAGEHRVDHYSPNADSHNGIIDRLARLVITSEGGRRLTSAARLLPPLERDTRAHSVGQCKHYARKRGKRNDHDPFADRAIGNFNKG